MRLTTSFWKKKKKKKKKKKNVLRSPNGKPRLNLRAGLLQKKNALETIVASIYKVKYSAVVSSDIRKADPSVFENCSV